MQYSVGAYRFLRIRRAFTNLFSSYILSSKMMPICIHHAFNSLYHKNSKVGSPFLPLSGQKKTVHNAEKSALCTIKHVDKPTSWVQTYSTVFSASLFGIR